jgi:hypothetical protein
MRNSGRIVLRKIDGYSKLYSKYFSLQLWLSKSDPTS